MAKQKEVLSIRVSKDLKAAFLAMKASGLTSDQIIESCLDFINTHGVPDKKEDERRKITAVTTDKGGNVRLDFSDESSIKMTFS